MMDAMVEQDVLGRKISACAALPVSAAPITKIVTIRTTAISIDNSDITSNPEEGFMNLTQRLAALREPKFQGEVRAAYAEFVAMLDRAQIAAHVLAPGAPMPDFLLPNAEGRLLSSDALLESGPLVVTFFRGDWCPFCTLMLLALEEALPELHAAGATLVAITPDIGGRALRAKRAHGLHYEVLSDVDNEAAMQFGVVVNPPESYRALLAEAGIDLAERHGNPGGFIPLPATFLVGADGIICSAWIDLDVTRRVEPAEIIDAVRRLPAGR